MHRLFEDALREYVHFEKKIESRLNSAIASSGVLGFLSPSQRAAGMDRTRPKTVQHMTQESKDNYVFRKLYTSLETTYKRNDPRGVALFATTLSVGQALNAFGTVSNLVYAATYDQVESIKEISNSVLASLAGPTMTEREIERANRDAAMFLENSFVVLLLAILAYFYGKELVVFLTTFGLVGTTSLYITATLDNLPKDEYGDTIAFKPVEQFAKRIFKSELFQSFTFVSYKIVRAISSASYGIVMTSWNAIISFVAQSPWLGSLILKGLSLGSQFVLDLIKVVFEAVGSAAGSALRTVGSSVQSAASYAIDNRQDIWRAIEIVANQINKTVVRPILMALGKLLIQFSGAVYKKLLDAIDVLQQENTLRQELFRIRTKLTGCGPAVMGYLCTVGAFASVNGSSGMAFVLTKFINEAIHLQSESFRVYALILARYLENLVDIHTASYVLSMRKRSHAEPTVMESVTAKSAAAAAAVTFRSAAASAEIHSPLVSMKSPVRPYSPVQTSLCDDIFSCEPYKCFFEALDPGCRLYNAYKEYVSMPLIDGTTLIWPQELVEYLNIRTTFREFSRPVLTVMGPSGRKASCGLNGIGSDYHKFTEFFDVFYEDNSTFCLTDARYRLDDMAYARFPYLKEHTKIRSSEYYAIRLQRKENYLVNPAPSISHSEYPGESNGSSGRKYQELLRKSSMSPNPNHEYAYMSCPYFPIRDELLSSTTRSPVSRSRSRTMQIITSTSRFHRLCQLSELEKSATFARDFRRRNVTSRLCKLQALAGGRSRRSRRSRRRSRRSRRRSSAHN